MSICTPSVKTGWEEKNLLKKQAEVKKIAVFEELDLLQELVNDAYKEWQARIAEREALRETLSEEESLEYFEAM